MPCRPYEEKREREHKHMRLNELTTNAHFAEMLAFGKFHFILVDVFLLTAAAADADVVCRQW